MGLRPFWAFPDVQQIRGLAARQEQAAKIEARARPWRHGQEADNKGRQERPGTAALRNGPAVAHSVAAGAAVIVDENAGYTLVDKIGVAGEIAEARYDDDPY